MNPKNYSEAVLKSIEAGKQPEEVLNNLKDTLEKRGHTKLYPRILKELQKLLEQHQKSSRIVVRVSNESQLKKHKSGIDSEIEKLGVNVAPEVVVDESLVGGYTIETNNMRVDASYKKALVDLYRSLTV